MSLKCQDFSKFVEAWLCSTFLQFIWFDLTPLKVILVEHYSVQCLICFADFSINFCYSSSQVLETLDSCKLDTIYSYSWCKVVDIWCRLRELWSFSNNNCQAKQFCNFREQIAGMQSSVKRASWRKSQGLCVRVCLIILQRIIIFKIRIWKRLKH